MKPIGIQNPLSRKTVLLFFSIVAMIIAMTGYGFYQDELRTARFHRVENLKSIADLKMHQILSWRDERIADAKMNSSGMLRLLVHEQAAAGGIDGNRKEMILTRMRFFQEHEKLQNMMLTDERGRLHISLNPLVTALSDNARNLVAHALSSKQAIWGDIHHCPDTGGLYLDVAAPILDDMQKPIAALMLRSNPDDVLFPILEVWPTSSLTGETLLVRMEPGHVVVLSRLRHSSDPPLFARPMDRFDVIKQYVKAGKDGLFEGLDYRGVSVTADIRSVPDSAWILVTKMDTDEILTGSQTSGGAIGVLTMAAILLIGVGSGLITYRFEKRHIEYLFREERAKRDANDEIRATLYGIGDGVISIDTSGRIVRMNPVAEQLTGWQESEALGRRLDDVFSIINETTRRRVDSPVSTVLQKGVVVGLSNHTLLVSRDGAEHPIADSGAPIRNADGKLTGVVLVFRDQTVERASQNALRDSEKRLKLILKSMINAFARFESVFDDDGRFVSYRFVYINDAYERITGVRQPDVVGKTVHEVWPETEQSWVEAYGEVALTGIPKSFEMVHAPTEKRYYCHVFRPNPDESQFCVIFEDITHRNRTEERLRVSEERLRAILEAVADPIVVYDTEGHPIFINPAFTSVFGWSMSEIAGKQIPFVPEDQNAITVAKIQELFQSKSSVRLETKRLTRDGRMLDILISAAIILDSASMTAGLVVNLTDITKNKQMEKQILQAQKMEAIGALAGGIAHDFNNILFSITGLTQMLLWDTPSDSPIHDRLMKIFQAATRAGDLVKQILTFSRRSELQKLPVRVQSVLKEVVKLARSTIPSNIDIKTHIQADCGKVMADPTQLHQIAMNLITNAYHAVERSGGSIHIELLEARLEKNHPIGGPTLPRGKYVLIRISDTGSGIDPVIMNKIFDPYFTTKPQGKGTGLGLAVVHGIVKESGGDIRVDSWLGHGTTFYVYLPLVEKEQTIENKQEPDPTPTGAERILLVDDEEAIVEMEKNLLQRLGYHITGITDSRKALADFEANPDQYDLVITDMAMPNLTGAMLSRKILEIRRDIPIILCTGFSETIDDETAKTLGIRGFALKPVSVKDIAILIRQVIDKPEIAALN